MMLRFNSIKVRLILTVTPLVLNIDISFNSIKVRLIPVVVDVFRDDSVFQFHKGSINTP